MKVLIAGFGSVGRRHFHNLQRLDEQDIIFYRTDKSTIDNGEISNFVIEHDLSVALEHQPDAVIISNPTSLHLDVALPSAQAGCHMLIEKPLSHNMDRVDILQEIVKKSNLEVLIGYQFRFHPNLMRVKNLLLSDRIGEIISVRAHWGEYLPDWHPWEDYREGYSAREDLGGGVVLTLSHPLDYLLWLFGDIYEVHAFLKDEGSLDLKGVEHSAEINLKFVSGVLGSVHLDYYQRPPVHSLEIIGSKGAIYWDGHSGLLKLFDNKKGGWIDKIGVKGFSRNDLFLAEIQHFIELVKGGTTPVCSLEDGAKVQKLIEIIKSSGKYGGVMRV